MRKKMIFLLAAGLALSGCGLLFMPPPPVPPSAPGVQGSVASAPQQNRVTVRGGLPGYGYAFGSCEGSRTEGRVWITFYYRHRFAPQSVHMTSGGDSYAMDARGNRYPIKAQDSWRDTRADVTEKVVLEARGVPPGVTYFTLVCQPFSVSTVGVSGTTRNTVLEMRRVPIVWK